MIKYLLITILLLTIFACGNNDSDNLPAPTPVPINSGDTYLVAPSTTNSKK